MSSAAENGWTIQWRPGPRPAVAAMDRLYEPQHAVAVEGEIGWILPECDCVQSTRRSG